MKYAIAPHGIFWSLQGEAHLRGFQMAFVRLAGCSVGCPGCDTDYTVNRRLTVEQVVAEVASITPPSRDRWAWITARRVEDVDCVVAAAREGW